MRSALYEGTIVHHRHTPVDHRFSYRIALPLIDLDEIDELFGRHPLWSAGHRNVVSFWRRDYLPGHPGSLGAAVADLVDTRLGHRPSGPVAVLTHPRTWGWLFNPITLYFCFGADGAHVEALVVEVTNTPWHERHIYVVGAPGSHRFEKRLHVSPFLDMDMDYELSYTEPGDTLSLSMRTVRGAEVLFDAGFRLRRLEADRRTLGRLIWLHPFMTMKVSGAIYREAFALWRAGVPISAHPRRMSEQRRAARSFAALEAAEGALRSASPGTEQHAPAGISHPEVSDG